MKTEKAKKDDLKSIVEIEKLSFDHPWTEETLEESIDKTWAVKIENKIVAFIIYELIIDEIHIIHMAVHPDYRRKGIAKKMIEKALSEKAKVAFLEVRKENTPAQRLYESFGFKEISRRKKYYPDGADALVMQLVIE
ncbi:MAG: ribosomal protein S18-alanine N-acetyltransferase [Candidatus Margulisiibacteriota bacterium]